VIRRPSPKLGAYLGVGAAGLLLGVVLGRAEPVILAAPLLLAALLAFVLVDAPSVSVDVSLDRDRILEGEDLALELRLRADRPVRWLELGVAVPSGLEAPDRDRVLGLQLDPGVARLVSVPVSGRRWGAYSLGRVAVRIRDRLGFFAFETTIDSKLAVRVFPRPETFRRVIRPAATQATSGNEVSRRHGDGIEFAGVRPYAPGDEIRRVNWRLSSQRPELYVNERHHESNTDIVVLLDTFTDINGPTGDSTLAMAVRGANGIADRYLHRHDRVGLIAFGGSIRWLVPAMGMAQSYRILESLLDARAAVSFIWKGVDLIPPRSLPPKALVLALSPLLDERTLDALVDLRRRGFDLAVIEIAPDGYVAAATDDFGTTARRLWQMQRELLRDRFRRLGVAVAPWSVGEPLEVALEEIRAFRRNGQRALA
jgi:uncharacterized protein (DUF58 family)